MPFAKLCPAQIFRVATKLRANRSCPPMAIPNAEHGPHSSEQSRAETRRGELQLVLQFIKIEKKTTCVCVCALKRVVLQCIHHTTFLSIRVCRATSGLKSFSPFIGGHLSHTADESPTLNKTNCSELIPIPLLAASYGRPAAIGHRKGLIGCVPCRCRSQAGNKRAIRLHRPVLQCI